MNKPAQQTKESIEEDLMTDKAVGFARIAFRSITMAVPPSLWVVVCTLLLGMSIAATGKEECIDEIIDDLPKHLKKYVRGLLLVGMRK